MAHGDAEMGHDEAQEEQQDADMGYLGLLTPSFGDEVSQFLLQQVGSGYQREARAASRKIVGWYSVGTRLVLGWYSVGTRLVLGWYSVGTRLVHGWY